MTKSISTILQESLCSEKNFLEEDEYESTLADLRVRFSALIIYHFTDTKVSVMEHVRPAKLYRGPTYEMKLKNH